MRKRAASQTDIITKVNVTPIIDVALVLVIILLVTAPLISASDLPVNLPAAHTREAEDESNVSITRTLSGDLAVDQQRVTRETLVPMVRSHIARAGRSDVLVVVRADAGTPYGEVKSLLSAARDAGAKRLALATRQQVEGGSR